MQRGNPGPMSLINTIKKFFGAREKSFADVADSALFGQLQANRETALRQIIPTRMMNEFLTAIYPDHRLKAIVKDIYTTYHDYLKAPDILSAYLQYVLRLLISTNRFGHRLILYHNIDPEVVVKTMLSDSDTGATEEA
jgi:hypothetical protein